MRLKLKQKIIKITKIALFTMVFVAVLMFIIPISYGVDLRKTALMVSGENDIETIVEIQIIGRYTRRFIRTDRFNGTISIDGFPLTQRSNYVVNIEVGQAEHEWLEYQRTGSTHFSFFTFGKIYAGRNFREILIVPFHEYVEDSAHIGGGGHLAISGETITVIAYSATERNHAIRIANRRLGASYPEFIME